MKRLLFAFVVVFIMGIIWGNLKTTPEKDNGKPTVKIGISLPLTGNTAFAGQPAKTGAELALEKWQNSDTKYNYELVIEDNQYMVRNMATTVNKFMNMDKVNAMVSMFGIEGKLFSESNNKSVNPIPHMACAWGTSSYKGKYNFNNSPSSEAYAEVIIEKMKKENISKVGIININAFESIEMVDIIVEKMKQEGIEVKFNEIVNPGEKDYRMLLGKIKNMDIDIIYYQLWPDDMDILKKQMMELNINTPITNSDCYDAVKNLSAYEGDWYISAILDDAEEMMNKIEEKGGVPATSCSTNTYDNVDMLINAFENAKSENGKVPTSEAVIEYLLNQEKWYGESAKEMIFREDGRIDFSPKVFVIKNGKKVLSEE